MVPARHTILLDNTLSAHIVAHQVSKQKHASKQDGCELLGQVKVRGFVSQLFCFLVTDAIAADDADVDTPDLDLAAAWFLILATLFGFLRVSCTPTPPGRSVPAACRFRRRGLLRSPRPLRLFPIALAPLMAAVTGEKLSKGKAEDM